MKQLQNRQGLHYIDAQRKSQAYQPNNLRNMSHNSSIGYDQNPNGANQGSLFEELADSTEFGHHMSKPPIEVAHPAPTMPQYTTPYPEGDRFDTSAQNIVNIQDLKVQYQGSSNFNEYVPMSMKPTYGAGMTQPAKNSSALDMNAYQSSSLMNQTYAIKFQVQYPTVPGESIGVIGSTEELGCWKKVRVHLQWTNGHNWVSTEPFVTHKRYFQFKYVLLKDMELVHWERGIDRIADLEILDDQGSNTFYSGSSALANTSDSNANYEFQSKLNRLSQSNQKIKYIDFNDVWEQFLVKFSIYLPTDDNSDQAFLEIISKQHSKNGIPTTIKMNKMQRQEGWLYNKYGKQVVPWQAQLVFDNTEGDNCGQWKNDSNKIQYNFVRNSGMGSVQKEREPMRTLEIIDPSHYHGQLAKNGSSHQMNTDRIFIVNSIGDKCDANFLDSFFVEKADGKQIFIGSYPLYDSDVSILQQHGINAVLNIQTLEEQNARSINQSKLKQFYRNHGISKVVNYPVDDSDESMVYDQLFQASLKLNEMIQDEQQRVFVHCTSGIVRAPTLVIIYLCLFMKHKEWQNPQKVEYKIKQNYQRPYYCQPNMETVQKVLNDNKKFQQDVLEWQRRLQEDMDKAKKLRQAQDEAERLRLKRLAEQEAEKLRLQRLQFEEAERLRLLRLQEQEAERLRLEKEAEIERLRLERLAEEERMRREEDERARRRREAEREAERLLVVLSKLEEDEAERLRLEALEKNKPDDNKYEHCAFGDMDLMGLSVDELDTQCDELFKTQPIEFVPRPDNEIDMAMAELIKMHNITIPILHIKDRLYLIGPNRMTCNVIQDNLMVRVGGGYEKFFEYVPKNHRYFERSLVVHMIKSGESLEGVVDALFNGRKLKNLIKESNEQNAEPEEPTSGGRKSVKSMNRSASSKSAKSAKRSASRNRPGFSFRDVDPYSKTKSINIQKVPSKNNYGWDQQENQGDTNNMRRGRSMSNERSPKVMKRMLSSSEYQSRKDKILNDLKHQYEVKMNNQPLYTQFTFKEYEIQALKEQSSNPNVEHIDKRIQMKLEEERVSHQAFENWQPEVKHGGGDKKGEQFNLFE